MLSLIVAIGNNNVIGKDNGLLWHLPEDLKRFKEITDGKTIIMGRNTFESLGKVLPNRKHVVLCSTGKLKVDDPNVKVVTGTNELTEYADAKEESFVIGGGIVYRILLPYVEKMYITRIYHDFDGDIFFPEINEKDWEVIEKHTGTTNEENPYKYEYITYKRRKKDQ